jgi:hypothetical protein
MGNCKVTPEAIWLIARVLLNRDAPRAPTAIHGYSSLKFLPKNKANAIAYCFENPFTHHDLCDERHEMGVEANVQDLLETEDAPPPEQN